MMKLKEIAARIEGELVGDGEREIAGIASLSSATAETITFVLNRSFEKYMRETKAAAIIVGQHVDRSSHGDKCFIIVKNPSLAHAQVAELFEEPEPLSRTHGVSDRAVVAGSATISDEATVHAFAYIDERAVIEKGVIVYPFSFIGKDVRIGEDTVIHPNVSIYDRTIIGKRVIVHSGAVLGSDGFAYVWDGKKHRKIPQLGTLEIGDDVEIGANTCIDRAALDKTVIARGTKLDNLVQVAHNVTVGENSIMAAQVGIAGSSAIGNGVILGGKVGAADHITIGDGVMAAGGTGITKNVEPGTVVAGNPHMAHRDWLKLQVYLRKIPDLFERLEAIEKEVKRAHTDSGGSKKARKG